MSTSISVMEQLPTAKLISSQYLNIKDDTDLFAVILMCSHQTHDNVLSIPLLRELALGADVPRMSTNLNLLHYAFKLQWPILAILSATLKERTVHYCWMAWLMIYAESVALLTETESLKEMTKFLILEAVRSGCARSLNQSFKIFHPESKFVFLTSFLAETSALRFSLDVAGLLDDYLLHLKELRMQLFDLEFTEDELIAFSVEILVQHVKVFSTSMEHCQLLLDCISSTGIDERMRSPLDFATLAKINSIIRFTSVRVRVEELIRADFASLADDDELITRSAKEQNEYTRIRDELVESKEFVCAMQIADLLDLTKDAIVYERLISTYKTQLSKFDLVACEAELARSNLSPSILINFLKFIADRIDFGDPEKYSMLKSILDLSAKYQLGSMESGQWDQFEFDLVKCVLRNSEPIDKIDVHHSSHYEEILTRKHQVIFESFVELKEMSGINELSGSLQCDLSEAEVPRFEELMNRLLDLGDVVQALRLQAMFNHSTNDLHYIVFCMALAEGLASMLDLSVEQKRLLNDGVKSAASMFNRRTLRLKRTSSSCSSSPVSRSFLDSVEMSSRVDFEELPSGAKQDLLDSIQVSEPWPYQSRSDE